MEILANFFENEVLFIISIIGLLGIPILSVLLSNSSPYQNAVTKEDLI